jgi:hypothetical protein
MQVPSVPAPEAFVPPKPVSSPARAFKTALALSLLITAGALVAFPFVQPVIPIFYTLASPDKQLAPKIWLFFFPLLAWLVTIFHFSLLKTMKSVEGTMLTIFCWATAGIVGVIGLLLVRVIAIVL